MEVEVIPPPRASSRFRFETAGTLGPLGTLLALLTMATAVGVGLMVFFGRMILAAGVVTLAWPLVFTPEFTLRVFGQPRVSFSKMFLLMLAAGLVVDLLMKGLGKRRG